MPELPPADRELFISRIYGDCSCEVPGHLMWMRSKVLKESNLQILNVQGSRRRSGSERVPRLEQARRRRYGGAMPTFDIVSQVDMQEVRNAVDQAQRELVTRFDFKGTESTVELHDMELQLHSATEDRLKAVLQVLERGHDAFEALLIAGQLGVSVVGEVSFATGRQKLSRRSAWRWPTAKDHKEGEGHRRPALSWVLK